MKKRVLGICTVLSVLAITAVAQAAEGMNEAVVVLVPSKGSKVGGVVVLKQANGYVHLSGEVTGLTPGKHGFHIHQFGDMRSDDGTATGGHYNPHRTPHGGPHSKQHHAGDFGNVSAGSNGVAKVDIKAKGLKLSDVLGRAIVIHGGTDDLKSQPSGAAGPRVAVGVIGLANVK